MAKPEPVMPSGSDDPIVAVYLLRVTLRGEGVKAPTLSEIERAVALTIEDIADDQTPDQAKDAPLPFVSVSGERVDK